MAIPFAWQCMPVCAVLRLGDRPVALARRDQVRNRSAHLLVANSPYRTAMTTVRKRRVARRHRAVPIKPSGVLASLQLINVWRPLFRSYVYIATCLNTRRLINLNRSFRRRLRSAYAGYVRSHRIKLNVPVLYKWHALMTFFKCSKF